MAVTSKWYGNAFTSAFNKELDFNSDTIKAMLVTSAYTFDQDAHQYKSSVTNEVTGAGYTAGGATLTAPTLTYTGATNVLKLSGGNVSWPSSSITARGLILYDSTPSTDATRPLLVFVDFGADVVSSGGPFDVTWDAAGIATVTVS